MFKRTLFILFNIQIYLQVIAKDLQPECEDQKQEIKRLHQASQAYLKGLFSEEDHVCPGTAKRESTNFFLMLSWIGLKEVIKCSTKDQELNKLVKEIMKTRGTEHDNHHHHHHPHPNHHHHNDHSDNEDEDSEQEHDHDTRETNEHGTHQPNESEEPVNNHHEQHQHHH